MTWKNPKQVAWESPGGWTVWFSLHFYPQIYETLGGTWTRLTYSTPLWFWEV